MVNTGSTVTSFDSNAHGRLFRGLMRAQIITLALVATVVGVVFDVTTGLAAAWGGFICLVAHAWAGFQIWLHPRNRDARHHAGAAIRAEMGKIAIILLLFWLSWKEWPELRERNTAASLLITFFLVQVVGWVWLIRATGTPPGGAHSGNKMAKR